jgi:hypothetical protein
MIVPKGDLTSENYDGCTILEDFKKLDNVFSLLMRHESYHDKVLPIDLMTFMSV